MNVLRDRVPVGRSRQQSAENEQVERALQQVDAGGRICADYVDILTIGTVGCLRKNQSTLPPSGRKAPPFRAFRAGI